MSYAVRVVAKHLSKINPPPYKLIRVQNKQQLTWGVIKFLILKDEFRQFQQKKYDWDIDGYLQNKLLDVDSPIANSATIIYKKVPLHYRETTHFIPHLAVQYTFDIDESRIKTSYY